MKPLTLALTLVTVLLASPAFGQRQTDKPEIPPRDGATFANDVTRVSTPADTLLAHTSFLGRSLDKRRQ